MAKTRFDFKVINQDKFWKAFVSDKDRMLEKIHTLWKEVGIKLLRRITVRYLSGRPGLNRISGNAARAMQVRTFRTAQDIIQEWEARGAGASYLPSHEGNEAGGPRVIMHPGTGNGFGKGINIPAHMIRIPKRTNIFNDITKLGDRLRIKSVNDAIKVFA